MSPTIVNSSEIPINDDLDIQKWLKEIENAEGLMSDIETKADSLQAKVDALLLEVIQPKQQEEEEVKEVEVEEKQQQ